MLAKQGKAQGEWSTENGEWLKAAQIKKGQPNFSALIAFPEQTSIELDLYIDGAFSATNLGSFSLTPAVLLRYQTSSNPPLHDRNDRSIYSQIMLNPTPRTLLFPLNNNPFSLPPRSLLSPHTEPTNINSHNHVQSHAPHLTPPLYFSAPGTRWNCLLRLF